MLSMEDKSKIVDIVTKVTNIPPTQLRIADGKICFNSDAGEDKTREACKALMEAGLQTTPGDGVPEFTISGGEGAERAKVEWLYNADYPMWGGPIVVDTNA